jgi:hypothetical protein
MFDELIRRRAQVFPDIAENIQQQKLATAKQSCGTEIVGSIFKQPNNFRYASAIPRRDEPELCMKTFAPKQRAWGMPGARCTRSRACIGSKHAR